MSHIAEETVSRTVGNEAARLCLIVGFDFRYGDEALEVPRSGQRLLAFLALHGRPLLREYVSGSLWTDSSEARSQASLRSTLWRLRGLGVDVVTTNGRFLCLADNVTVDLREGMRQAQAIAQGEEAVVAMSPSAPSPLDSLLGDLLPDWYEDWVVGWQEQWRQVRLHALEGLANRLLEVGRFGAAIDVALAAVRIEPLRESAHRCVIRVHMAEGNHVEARRHFDIYRRLVHCELGVEPSRLMKELVAAISPVRGSEPGTW